MSNFVQKQYISSVTIVSEAASNGLRVIPRTFEKDNIEHHKHLNYHHL